MARHQWIRVLVTAAVVATLLVVGAPYVYLHFIKGDAPAPLTIGESVSASVVSSTQPSSSGTKGGSGQWHVSDGSVVGYRVNEVLFGQRGEAVGRTDQVTGSVSVVGTSITDAGFSVDMTTVTSDEDRRDEQFNGRIMETATYPTATFALTMPINLGSRPREGVTTTATATGDLTLHGVTRSVTFDVAAKLDGDVVRIVGSVPVTFADYDIENPSYAPITATEDHGVLEFALNLTRSG